MTQLTRALLATANKARPSSSSALQRPEIRQHIRNLRWVEPELGHCGVACHHSFRERLGQTLNRIPLVQVSERRRDWKRARSHQRDGVALRTVRLEENAPSVCSGLLSQGGRGDHKAEQRGKERSHGNSAGGIDKGT